MDPGADHHPPRIFAADADIRRICAGLLSATLPRAEWTHEAHLAAVRGLLLEQPGFQLERELPGTIARFNEALGGINDDSQGYHETLTQVWIRLARHFYAQASHGPLLERVNAFILSPLGRRQAPLAHYSRTLIFSVAARRTFVEPDLMPLPPLPHPCHAPSPPQH